MKAASAPLFFPHTPGPWGVDTIGRDWYVIHRVTLTAKRIGPVGAKGANYLDKAMAEAASRNRKESAT